ncbi:MAG TPA: ECF-type sigma factor [Longimicrobiales bacterium]|nr:ECF-type sigma factor [Longimicrobiales bacterium]
MAGGRPEDGTTPSPPTGPLADGVDHDITALLREGGAEALRDHRLLALVYEDLRRIARARLRAEPDGHTLATVDLVHESYLRLVDQDRADWQDRRHFYRIAAMMMRRVLVDHARRRVAERRGGDRRRVTLDAASLSVEAQADLILQVDEVLERLAHLDARLPQVVECRWFAGYTEAETAELLGVSERTIRRDWTKARALIRATLGDDA